MITARIVFRISQALLFTLVLTGCAATSSLNEPASLCAKRGQSVDEKRFVTIGGIEQWITIKGEDCANPVVLFVHGGPGNPLSPYASAIYKGWEKEFTLVQWDQRGAGKTFTRKPPAEDATLTLEVMTSDGVAVAETVAQLLGQKKIIITGGSWGSVLAVHMIKSRPDLFAGYVGVSQLVSKTDNLSASYSSVMSLARSANDTATITALGTIGAPPWKNPRHFGVLRRATRVYEKKTSTPPPSSWWVPAPEYATATFEADTEAADDYSFLQYVGMNGDGMFSKVDLNALGVRFDVPMYFVHGDEDLVTVKSVAATYFESIEAPAKKFIAVPAAGHDPNEVLLDAQLKALREVSAQRK